MSANDTVCYACGAPPGEHQVDTLACPWGGRVTGVPLFQECVFQPLPERELVLTHERELYQLEEEESI